jgi:hypothetical protein
MNCTIENTSTTPYISFSDGKIYITGKSIPTVNFGNLKSFLTLIRRYSKEPEASTELNIDLDYINCLSKRCIMESLRILDKIYKKGYRIYVNWYYDKNDEYMLELGTIYNSLVRLPFNLIER